MTIETVLGGELDVPTILERAADLIEPEGAWTQETSFRDAEGRELDGDEPTVASCCMMGAINKVCAFRFDASVAAFNALGRFLGVDYLADWNDDPARTQDEVVTAFREAAALARSSVELGGGDDGCV